MNTQSRIGRWSVIIGIVIVLNLFFNYALSLVYKAPDYLAYCPQQQVNAPIETQEQCVAAGGQWNANAYYGKPIPGNTGVDTVRGYCDPEFTCRQQFTDANYIYSRNVFVILVVLGAIVVAVGNFFTKNGVIGSGLAFAGVLSFVIASMRYWGAASDLIRVVILLIALGLLFWVALKKFKN